jgi:citrate lyase subunit beta/citryl-CoA lyase
MLPKAELPEEALVLARELDRAEKEAGLLPGSIAIIPLIESGLGLHHCYDIAKASPRVRGLAFSSGEEGDFMADIDGQWSPDGAAMLYPRSKIVCENRAAGLVWVIDGVFMGFRDDEAFERECRASRRMGFQAKLAIHPQQIATIHQVFSPTPEEIERASALVAHYRDAESKGIGAISINGMMVDKANVEKAKRTLAAARRNKE